MVDALVVAVVAGGTEAMARAAVVAADPASREGEEGLTAMAVDPGTVVAVDAGMAAAVDPGQCAWWWQHGKIGGPRQMQVMRKAWVVIGDWLQT